MPLIVIPLFLDPCFLFLSQPFSNGDEPIKNTVFYSTIEVTLTKTCLAEQLPLLNTDTVMIHCKYVLLPSITTRCLKSS